MNALFAKAHNHSYKDQEMERCLCCVVEKEKEVMEKNCSLGCVYLKKICEMEMRVLITSSRQR